MSAVIGQAQGSPPCSGKSVPVQAPTTPGNSAAPATEIDVMLACAYGERSSARCSMPGSTMLSASQPTSSNLPFTLMR